MTTGLWILFWVLVSTGIAGILLLTANRKPVEAAREPADDVCAQMRRQMPYRPEPSPYNYLADIYPQTGEYPKEFAAGSTAVAEVKFEHKPYPELTHFRGPSEVELAKAVHEGGKVKRPSVKSKTPAAKKAPAKKAKPVAKKATKKKV